MNEGILFLFSDCLIFAVLRIKNDAQQMKIKYTIPLQNSRLILVGEDEGKKRISYSRPLDLIYALIPF